MDDSLTLIQEYVSYRVASLISEIKATSKVEHRLTKGQLRERTFANFIKPFLTHQFGLGTGVIVNKNGKESNQTDIIVYDKSIIPPFIANEDSGIYPAESVLAVIEIKSNLTKAEIEKTEKAFKNLCENIYNPDDSIFKAILEDQETSEEHTILIYPLCSMVGFTPCFTSSDEGEKWLSENTKYISMISSFGEFSCININHKWKCMQRDELNEETKRFIAVFIDNLRTVSYWRTALFNLIPHKDWIGSYIRKIK